MEDEMIPVGLDDQMEFNCSSQNSCFNDCCRDLSQALTPYDILRMKNNLGMSSQEFLREYTSRHTGPGSGLPMIEFKPNPQTGHACPFVTDKGCFVYPDRPGSCRLYPLARAISRSRQTGQVVEYFALIKEDHCKGFGNQSSQTVKEWLAGQEVAVHNFQNDKLMMLISAKNTILPGPLDPVQADNFYMALYDIDEFRDRILKQDLLKNLNVPSGILNSIRDDDEKLLDFGLKWIQYILFGMEMKFEG